MSDTPSRWLTGEQVRTVRFAVQRQLTRWSNTPGLSPHQQAQRSELRRAADVLNDRALAHGCELRVATDDENVDG